MQIVIDITEEVFNEIMSADDASHLSRVFLKGSHLYFKEALQNGTPLPKGHGRLSDVDWILNKMSTTDAQPITPNEHYAWDFAKALLRKAPTVIEADEEGSEEEK